MKTYFGRLALIAVILSVSVGCDQATKEAADIHLSHVGAISFWGDTFRLQYTENGGAFLGMGATLPEKARFWLLIVFSLISVIGMLFFLLFHRSPRPLQVVGLTFIIGGGIGNLIDRIFRSGAVRDFMNVGLGDLRTGIFNVADVAIMLGTMMLIFMAAQRKTTSFGGRRRNRHVR